MRRLLGCLLILGCGADANPPPVEAGAVRVTNGSQYDLQQLRIHRTLDYLSINNLLETEAAPDEDLVVFYGEGGWYFTVIRERYLGGPPIALTTQEPVVLERAKGYLLTVFDQSFRVEQRPWIAPEEAQVPYFGQPYLGTRTSTTD